MKILARDRAVGEMDLHASAVHADAAKSRSVQRDGSIASPILRVVILAPNCEVDCGRALPFPFPEKFRQIERDKRSHRAGTDCTVDIQTKIARAVEEIGPKLACLIPFAVHDNHTLRATFSTGAQGFDVVVAPLQAVPAQCRLEQRILDFCNVSASFYLL